MLGLSHFQKEELMNAERVEAFKSIRILKSKLLSGKSVPAHIEILTV